MARIKYPKVEEKSDFEKGMDKLLANPKFRKTIIAIGGM